jgi:hypothetical protein
VPLIATGSKNRVVTFSPSEKSCASSVVMVSTPADHAIAIASCMVAPAAPA